MVVLVLLKGDVMSLIFQKVNENKSFVPEFLKEEDRKAFFVFLKVDVKIFTFLKVDKKVFFVFLKVDLKILLVILFLKEDRKEF